MDRVAETTTSQEVDRLRKRLARRERELDAARRISESLFQHVTVDALVERALLTALEVVDAAAGSVLLAEPDTKQLIFRYSVGERPVPRGTAIPWEQGIAGSVFRSREPIIITDVKTDTRHCPTIDALTQYTTRDMIALPLKRWEGEPIGVLEVLNKRNGHLDDEDVAILMLISAFSAIAIEEARLFEEAKVAEVVRLLGDISHDVKNMLMPVVMGAGLLREEITELFQRLQEKEADKVQSSFELCNETIDMLKQAANRIQDRVKEIADCVKGLIAPPDFAPCRIDEIVASVMQTLRCMAQEKGVSLQSERLETLPTVIGDERRLFNAFYNLINNAIPEVPSGGSVTVRGELDGDRDWLLLSVADTGRGMPPEIRNSLFTTRAISRKPGGTGLGTKIVKDVVDIHGGEISVDSEVDRGTTFRIRLPLQPRASLPTHA
ncbi:GAF domain-containing sensor histidine kinase [Candidatus Nitrospira bockiana]